jgi:DNA-binding CsgD family transcriptional regulator
MVSDPEVSVTAREQEVLRLLEDGLSNKEIADALGCSVRTVEFHISNLLRKAGVSSRLELVTRGHQGAASGTLRKASEAPLIDIRIFSGATAAVLGDTVLMLWASGATAPRWAWKRALLEERVAANESGVLCLSLILPSSTPPDADVRAQMKADLHRLGPQLRRFVAVPLGNSMWMGIVRAVGKAVLFVSGRSSQQTLASSVEEGLTRLLEASSASTPPRHELEEAVAELARLLGVESPFIDKKAG